MESAEFIDRKKCISCEPDNIIALSSGLFNEGVLHEFISNDLWEEDPAPFLKNKQWRYVKCSDCDQAFHQFILGPEWNERRFSKWMPQGESNLGFRHAGRRVIKQLV